MEKKRTVLSYKNYFDDFYLAQTAQVRGKITWTIDLIRTHERIPEKYLKHITGTDGLYEIRIQSGSDIFRIFCFFDKGNIVLGNGFQKKTEKTPQNEIDRAIKIKKDHETKTAHKLRRTR